MSAEFSPREQKVLELAAQGLTDKGIAEAIGISAATVVTYWGRIRAKTGLISRAELVGHFIRRAAEAEVVALRQELEAHIDEEQRLRTSLELLQGFVDAAPEAMLIVDPDGRIESGNALAAELLECDQSEFQSLRVGRFIPPEIHDLHKVYREQYIKDPTRIVIGHGTEGVEMLTCKGRRMRAIVTINAAVVHGVTKVIVILRGLSAPEPEMPDDHDLKSRANTYPSGTRSA